MRILTTSIVAFGLTCSAAAADRSPNLESLIGECVAVADGGHTSNLGNSRQFLAAHRIRMRGICADWRTLTGRGDGDAAALLERCVDEARRGPARFRTAAFGAHVRAGEAVCHDLYWAVTH